MNTRLNNRQTRPFLEGQTSGSRNTTLASANRWRDQYNPLRGLRLSSAIPLLEAYKLGQMAELQWLYAHVEETDEDLIALTELRTGAICEMDWQIKIISPRRRTQRFSQAQAEDQAAILRATYDGIDNLYAGIEHMAMASFRGFAHLEKHYKDGQLAHLEILDQWNVVRNGLRGSWKYNPDARSTGWESLPKENELDPAWWVIRDRQRHIDRVALIKFIRMNLGLKDWTAFVEIYGIPQPVVTLPPEIPAGKEDEYAAAAQSIASGQPGALPHGSTVSFPADVRGQNPFAGYLEYLTRRLVLAGTGGMLTMLNDATGMGSGQADSHRQTFYTLAAAEARGISELFQRSIDLPEIRKVHGPDAPILAYFELCFNEETDTGKTIDNIQKLSAAGYKTDPAQVAEKTGWKVDLRTQELDDPAAIPSPPLPGAEFSRNRSRRPAKVPNRQPDQGQAGAAVSEFVAAVATDLKPFQDRLEAILAIEDLGLRKSKLETWVADLDAVGRGATDPDFSARLNELRARAAQPQPPTPT